MSTTRLDRETRRYSTTRLERRDEPRDNRPALASRRSVRPAELIEEATDFQELKEAIHLAFEDLVFQINEQLSVISKYMDPDGKIVHGGVGRGAIDGQAMSDGVRDEFQTMGSTLSDSEWADLY